MHPGFTKDLQFYKFSLYGFLKNLRFFEPFLYLFFLEQGLNFLQIGKEKKGVEGVKGIEGVKGVKGIEGRMKKSMTKTKK